MMDTLLITHVIIGLAIIVLSIVILINLKSKSKILKVISSLNAALSWLLLYPSGKLYLTFYPATKNVINAGAWPWAHGVVMETKEHWGLLIPIIATVAAFLIFKNKYKESKKWFILLIVLSALIGLMGRLIKIGALK